MPPDGLVGEESSYTLSFFCPAPVHSNGEELDFFSEALNSDTFGSGRLQARRTFLGSLVVGPLPPPRLPVPGREVTTLLDHRRGRKTFGADPTTWPEELRDYLIQ